jgi:hypothetical protein
MKTMIKLVLLAAMGVVFAGPALGVTPPAGVTVAYAFVPKDRLSEAVKGKQEALKIEALWRQEMMAKSDPPPYPLNLGNQKYSIVVFVEIPARFALWGRIGIPVQNPSHPVVLNVNLAPGYSGTYVIDGGGLILTEGIPPDPKPYEWLEIHTE